MVPLAPRLETPSKAISGDILPAALFTWASALAVALCILLCRRGTTVLPISKLQMILMVSSMILWPLRCAR
jgi:hypothetical protein